LALALACFATHARADGDYISPTDDRVRITAGFIRVSSATTLQVDSSAGVPGTVINGEDQFGLDKSDFLPKFQIAFRVNARNRIRFDYFTLDRDGNTLIQAPIAFRDSVLQIGDPTQTELNLRLLGLTYGYSFWHGEKLELAATLTVDSVTIAAQAKVQTESHHVYQTEDAAGPFPTPGLDATWVLSKRFYFDGRAQYLSVHVHNLDGSLSIFEFDGLYRFRPNVAFGLGYTQVKAHLASTESGSAGYFDLSTKGPELFVRVSF
jgi:hypothetical protein